MSQRLSSITTRIKTSVNCFLYFCVISQRLSSITTRIKTLAHILILGSFDVVRDYLPLQQGLRQKNKRYPTFRRYVRDYLPLQQGLRPDPEAWGSDPEAVRDYLPLQQGLRPAPIRAKITAVWSQRLSSITTRIKTATHSSICSCLTWSETIFHYNKD